ncbi:MAG TPA: DUF2007 domain-containing protein [Armatimonadota bacterium]|nr:DUF2007 domain-containing protein [Armatimonadota bacterium]
MGTDELVPVFDAPDEIQALLYQTMLEEAGIGVVERTFEPEWLEGVMQRGLHSQLLVRAADAETARALVESFSADADAGALDAEAGQEAEAKEEYGTPES